MSRAIVDLAARLWPPRPGVRLGVDLYEDDDDERTHVRSGTELCGTRRVTACTFASTNASSSSRVPGVTERRSVTVIVGARGLQQAHAEALEQLQSELRAEVGRLPPTGPAARREPTRLELEAAIVAAEIRGDATAVAALTTELVSRAEGIGKYARPEERPRRPAQHGEMALDSRDVVDVPGPPKGTGFL